MHVGLCQNLLHFLYAVIMHVVPLGSKQFLYVLPIVFNRSMRKLYVPIRSVSTLGNLAQKLNCWHAFLYVLCGHSNNTCFCFRISYVLIRSRTTLAENNQHDQHCFHLGAALSLASTFGCDWSSLWSNGHSMQFL